MTVTVSENQEALFRCRHERADAFIVWQINGLPSNQYSDVVEVSIQEGNETKVPTLTIPAIPIYNGSVVVCGATFFDGSAAERTPPVTLTITGQL